MACAHSQCGCGDEKVKREGRGYCSDRCAERDVTSARTMSQPAHEERSAHGCGCGHPGCD